MKKLKMHTPNVIDDNIAELAELFPNCVTEIRKPQADTDNAGWIRTKIPVLSRIRLRLKSH